ncbi:hypothetical protein IE81DRAFT_170156 [Ceraceosorus guamensis]|uniref:Uncharacterized protein n=1 Tax=Ceraceosorus guamensis TaxID=1522189 RepID=A0A316VVG9_9BASI|nr:hypothetical protein IE81DRAFT_170156 [Ceraceosorus guamensis]PWN41637.1 hypothetical protein IE81DRAFT_170156 [Ceraceosorus guamensis]
MASLELPFTCRRQPLSSDVLHSGCLLLQLRRGARADYRSAALASLCALFTRWPTAPRRLPLDTAALRCVRGSFLAVRSGPFTFTFKLEAKPPNSLALQATNAYNGHLTRSTLGRRCLQDFGRCAGLRACGLTNEGGAAPQVV